MKTTTIFKAGDNLACRNCDEVLYQVKRDIIEQYSSMEAEDIKAISKGISDPKDGDPLQCPACFMQFPSGFRFLKKVKKR